jgi:hypothetical protein
MHSVDDGNLSIALGGVWRSSGISLRPNIMIFTMVSDSLYFNCLSVAALNATNTCTVISMPALVSS